jgi:hypothetical protein
MRIVSELARVLRSQQLLSEEDERRLREFGVADASDDASSHASVTSELARAFEALRLFARQNEREPGSEAPVGFSGAKEKEEEEGS